MHPVHTFPPCFPNIHLNLGHSPPFSAEVKECVELYIHSTNTPS
jgi:hypothetical protein